jgi:hypothetical protein
MSFLGHTWVCISSALWKMYWWWKAENLWDPWCPTELFLRYTCKSGLDIKEVRGRSMSVWDGFCGLCQNPDSIQRDSYRVCFIKDFVMSCWSGNHPQNNLAKFGYIQVMKVAKKAKKPESLFILGYLLPIIKIWWFQCFSFEIW